MLRHVWALLGGVCAAGGVAVMLVLFPGAVGWHVYKMPSVAMEQTLPIGSYVASQPHRPPVRGDVVAMRDPWPAEQQGRDLTFVKRVVALGGDTIECCDAAGRVMLNGKSLDEPYVYQDDKRPFGPVHVRQGRLFVLGDNRSQSADSRVHAYNGADGTVSDASVIGVVHGPDSHLGASTTVVSHYRLYLLALGAAVFLSIEILMLITRRSAWSATR